MNKNRLKFLSIALFFYFLLVVSRLFYWQIIQSSQLKEKALLQTYKLTRILPNRGLIYSPDNYPLALNQDVYLLSIYKPNLTSDLDSVVNKIGLVKPDFLTENSQLLNNFKNNSSQKWLSFPTEFTSQETKNLLINGITFQLSQKRFYPENQLGKNIIGSLGKNTSGTTTGLSGLEGYYNKQLKGKTGFVWSAVDATGKTILSKKFWQTDSFDGQDLHTSLNRSLQYQVEKFLKDGISKYSADSGSIIVMQPQSGAVMAISSLVATASATPSAVHNTAISDLFEPGSIFKPLVVTMALDSQAITTDFICTRCNQPRVIGQYSINNWNSELHPDSSLQDIIKNSDNIGMSYIIYQLGLNNFLSYFQKLGLTQKTGIDLTGEAKPPLKSIWPDIDFATASFGQGFAITQIQMLQAFNVLANDGKFVHPHLVDYLTEKDVVYKPHLTNPVDIFKPESVNQIKDILKYSVENGVVAKFKPKDIEVCAKSGTAQVAVKGAYTDSSTIASYIGFSPCQHPKFSMIVTINNPRTSPWGSSTAAPIWYDLAEIINRLL